MATETTSRAGDPELVRELVFYDGSCGVCHAAVRFLARRDRDGSRFRYAPLGGDTFAATVAPERARALPDSLVIARRDGALLVRTQGTIHSLRRLGGLWHLPAALLWLVPRPLRDWAYDRFAAIRHRLAPTPEGTCPLVPPAWRDRFLP